MEKYKVGVIGATGMVGQRFVSLLEHHPWFQLTALAASPRSAGKPYGEAVGNRWVMKTPLPEQARALTVLDAQADVEKLAGMVDFVFCAVDMKKEDIRALEERYARAECPVVSNNSAHRWTDDVPMVVPELNPEHIQIIPAQRKRLGTKRGFIAVKSNCSIQSYAPLLTPLMRAGYEIDQVLACTYQAISGAGKTFERWPEMVDIHHLRPAFKGLACPGDGLVGAGQHLVDLVARPHQRGEKGGVALDGAVGLHRNKAPFGPQPLSLGGDDLNVLRVELGDHHGHVVSPAVGGVVGDHWALGSGVPLLQGADVLLFHVHRAENKVHHARQLLHIRLSVQHGQRSGLLGEGSLHNPAVPHRLPVGFSGGAGAGRQGGELKPGVVLQQGDKALPHHPCGADDSDLILFHCIRLHIPISIYVPDFGKCAAPAEKNKSAAFQAADFVL